MAEKIRLTRDDLYAAKVNGIVAEQEALARAMPAFSATPTWRKIVFSSLFFLSVAGALGALAGWGIIEPFMNEAIIVRGAIENTEGPRGVLRSQGQTVYVRGIPILADDRVTRIVGRGQFEMVKESGDLTIGHPVRAAVMILQQPGEDRILIGTRIVVEDLPPEHKDEPVPDIDEVAGASVLSGVFGFAIVGACIAGLIAAADGLMSRNLRRGFLSAACGVGIAIGGGLVGLIPGGIVLALGMSLITAMSDGLWTSDSVTGVSLLILIVSRSLTWGILGLTVGLGQGAAMRSKKLFVNGLLGGMLGGLLGGIFFEPLIKAFANTDIGGQAMISRMIGFSIIGASAGFMIGLVEHLAKDAWLLMRAGPLAGKQFIIYKSPTTLGSSPKCEVYLFKDPAVEPRHALIRKVGSRHEIEDMGTPSGTLINGQPVRRQTLREGDQIVIGKTLLEFAERSRGG